MPNIHYELVIDPAEAARVKRELSSIPNGARRALSGALNKTLEHGRTLVKRVIMDELRIRQKAALRVIQLHKSTPAELSGSVQIINEPIPMGEYHPVQTAAGVRVSPRRGMTQLIRGAFIATMPLRGAMQREGHVGVFKRKKNARHKLMQNRNTPRRKALIQGAALPIYELMGPTAIGVLANNPDRSRAIQDELNQTLSKNIESQIQRLQAAR